MKTHNRFISRQIFAKIDPTDYLISLTKIAIGIYEFIELYFPV